MTEQKVVASGRTIRGFFSEIPSTYDLINSLMTFGLDEYWRKRAAKLATRAQGSKWLDICAGTGRMTLNLARMAQPHTLIVALDFCSPMLRLLDQPSGDTSIRRCLGNVGKMPFPDGTFDLVTVAFATRNLHSDRETLIQCFSEVRRVLKSGGRFMNLETSQPPCALIRNLFHQFIGISVNLIGTLVSGSESPYKYLASSIRSFYFPGELSELLQEAGFSNVSFFPMTFGSVAVHLAWKL